MGTKTVKLSYLGVGSDLQTQSDHEHGIPSVRSLVFVKKSGTRCFAVIQF